jgi:hypothetical protein
MGTFCGKVCDECTWKEKLACMGCQTESGSNSLGTCGIADCCRQKGHESCSTCSFLSGCRAAQGKESVPDRRLKEKERLARERDRRAEEQRKLDERAPVIGKWLRLLFWLIIPATVSGVMVVEQVVAVVPVLQIPGQILGFACNLACVWFMFKLVPFSERYRTAALCALISTIVAQAVNLVGFEQDTPLWWLLTIPAMVLAYVGTYQKFYAHAEILEGIDAELSGKWRMLWKWFIGIPLAMLGSVLVMLIIPVLGLLVLLAAVIAFGVISIIEWVYLYRTAQRFCSHEPEEREALPGETAL